MERCLCDGEGHSKLTKNVLFKKRSLLFSKVKMGIIWYWRADIKLKQIHIAVLKHVFSLFLIGNVRKTLRLYDILHNFHWKTRLQTIFTHQQRLYKTFSSMVIWCLKTYLEVIGLHIMKFWKRKARFRSPLRITT